MPQPHLCGTLRNLCGTLRNLLIESYYAKFRKGDARFCKVFFTFMSCFKADWCCSIPGQFPGSLSVSFEFTLLKFFVPFSQTFVKEKKKEKAAGQTRQCFLTPCSQSWKNSHKPNHLLIRFFWKNTRSKWNIFKIFFYLLIIKQIKSLRIACNYNFC